MNIKVVIYKDLYRDFLFLRIFMGTMVLVGIFLPLVIKELQYFEGQLQV